MSKSLTGAQILWESLVREGVSVVFGYPGGAVLWIYDELFKQDKIHHVLVRHEQAAVHAADAYSRSSQRVGVALVTSGPGVTNAVSFTLFFLNWKLPNGAFESCQIAGLARLSPPPLPGGMA